MNHVGKRRESSSREALARLMKASTPARSADFFFHARLTRAESPEERKESAESYCTVSAGT